jgi:phosphocarrier protein
MVEKEIILKPGSWLHAKSAAEFIQKASVYKSAIWVEKDSRKANAKSLLGLLALEISPGSGVRLIAQGEDEEEAIRELSDFLAQNV